MTELSEEMQQEITRELLNDLERMKNLIMQRPYHSSFVALTYQELEQLVYMTEQVRLKLRTLGAPRIYQ